MATTATAFSSSSAAALLRRRRAPPSSAAPNLLSFKSPPKVAPFPSPLPLLRRRRTPRPLRLLAASSAAENNGSSNPYAELDLRMDKPREECGVVGVVGDPDAASLCYLALQKLQHRGEEGAGIAAADPSSSPARLRSVTGLGLVTEVFSDPSLLASLPGRSAIGHVRYSTSGDGSPSAAAANVQPFLASYRFGQLAVAHNGNLVNYRPLRSLLESRGSIFNTSSDTEVLLHLIAASPSRPLLSRILGACEALEGAFSLILLSPTKLFAVRDPFGFRPLVLGRRPNGALAFASETCALDLIDAEYLREVEPGELVAVDARDMSVSSLCLLPRRPRRACVFEHVYFALPNSLVFGRPVHASRSAFGRALAEESPAPGADVVIPVPDSGFYAALGFSHASGVPFQQGLLRSHYVGRTFIQPSQDVRDLAVKLKLAPVPGVLKGRSVVVVDDSLVRGTTSSKIVRLLRGAGAREVHVRIASPPVVASCYYGVDTPSADELVSNRMDPEGVRRLIGADSLAFLSLDKLRAVLGDEAPTFCDACFSRDYPIPPPQLHLHPAAAAEPED